jgi:hypothetical protein
MLEGYLKITNIYGDKEEMVDLGSYELNGEVIYITGEDIRIILEFRSIVLLVFTTTILLTLIIIRRKVR